FRTRERDGGVNSRGMFTRDSESFGGRLSGSERNLGGCTRTPNALGRTRERRLGRGAAANPHVAQTNRETPGIYSPGVSREPVGLVGSEPDHSAPRTGRRSEQLSPRPIPQGQRSKELPEFGSRSVSNP